MDIIGDNNTARVVYSSSAYDFTDPLASMAAVDAWTWAPINQVSDSSRISGADCSGVLYGYNAVNGWRTDPVIATSRTQKPDRAMGETKKEVAFDTFEEILEDAS